MLIITEWRCRAYGWKFTSDLARAADDILAPACARKECGRRGSRPRDERDIETASLGIGSRLELPNKAVRRVINS